MLSLFGLLGATYAVYRALFIGFYMIVVDAESNVRSLDAVAVACAGARKFTGKKRHRMMA